MTPRVWRIRSIRRAGIRRNAIATAMKTTVSMYDAVPSPGAPP